MPPTAPSSGVLFVLFLTLSTIYYETLQPSVPGGDSGELVTEAYQLGLPHPPGYPLHSMLGYLASHTPFRTTVARDLNLLSAFFGAVTSSIIYAATVLLIAGRGRGRDDPMMEEEENSNDTILLSHFAGILAAFSFSLSPLVWTYSITAEVFALNNFFSR